METKYCSTYAYPRLISSFLKDTSTPPNSRVYVICIPCRETTRRSVRKRKASRQLAPENPPILLDTSIPINIRVEPLILSRILMPPPLPPQVLLTQPRVQPPQPQV